jgi:hypothetical protein
MREQKWGHDNLQEIVENYDPNRREEQLAINGIVVARKHQKLITEDFNKEAIIFVDYIHPNNKVFNIYGGGLNIGVRSTVARFFTYSAGIGFQRAQYADDEKIDQKYPDRWQNTFKVAQDDFSGTTCFNANVFLGGQLPFRDNRFYLIPAAGWNFGTLWSMDFATEYHGLQLSFDFGYKMKYGSTLFAGLSFRQMKPIKKKSDENNWVFQSNPEFFKYPNADAIVLRAGYKF